MSQNPHDDDIDVGGPPGADAGWNWSTAVKADDRSITPASSPVATDEPDPTEGRVDQLGSAGDKPAETSNEPTRFIKPPVPRESRTPLIGKYREAPAGGLAKLLFKWSNGRWKFHNRLGKRIQRYTETITARRLKQGVVMAVVAFGGGLGKTTVSVRIAQQLRRLWNQNVLIIDMNSSPGTLASRLGVDKHDIQAVKNGRADQACWTFEDVWRLRDELDGFPEINWRFAYDRKQGLFVLAGEIPSERDKSRFAGVDFQVLMKVLKKHFAFIVLDCGTNPWESVPQQILSTADVFVIPTTTSHDRLEQVADVVTTMQKERLAHQLKKLVIVTNRMLFNPLNRGTDRAMDTVQEILASDRYERQESQDDTPKPEPYTCPVINMPWRLGLWRGRTIKSSRLSGRKSVEAMQITAAAMEIVYNGRPMAEEAGQASLFEK